MTARDRHEPHRVATSLELLFDLCFVVAIAQAAASLHHAYVAGHAKAGLVSFGLVFFAIWWAWMNFTWYASAYDTDDVPYRLKVLLQIVGVLVIAAGVPRAFVHRDYSIVTIGYAIMRVGLVACWLRAGAAETDPARKRTAFRYAAGVALCEVGWIGAAFIPATVWLYVFGLLVALELAVPMWAERTGATTWHPHHIVERYGLLALIVIGESVLSTTLALQAEVDLGARSPELEHFALVAGAVLVLFGSWWIYFDHPAHHVTRTNRDAFVWGYGHYFIFAALAATGAGLAAATDILAGKTVQPAWQAGAVVAIPVAIFLAALWVLVVRQAHVAFVLAIAAVLGAIVTPLPVLVVGAVIVALIIALRRLTKHGS
jgi:low temperature requirement protein LtrA